VARASVTTQSLTVGDHAIGAWYSGDPQNPSATAAVPLLHRVVAASPGQVTVSLGGLPNSFTGDSVTFQATVIGNSPTGTVQFKDNGVNRWPAVGLSAEGRATLTVQGLEAGIHPIMATYSSDLQNAAGDSAVLTHTVANAVTTEVALSFAVNPTSTGATVTVTANVSGNNPTGSVAFRVDSALISTVILSGGSASALVNLAPGLHVVEAAYLGDSNNAGASSALQQVAIAQPGGQPVQLTVTKVGVGTGTVTSAPGGISCGSTCTAPFNPGAPVLLTATPAAGSIFSGWSGACFGQSTCSLTMDYPKAVSANFANAGNPPRLGNISTRGLVLGGDDVMIGGFVIGGPTAKRVAIVATGPSLSAYGITNPLPNPAITLVRSSDQTVVASNNDWQSAANQADLTAAGFAPSNSLEAGILADLAPGAYTAIVQGNGGGTGISVIGVYEVNGPAIPLINISTRGRVGTANDVMIGGFVITGDGPQTVAIVATGPSLGAYGITNPLANPKITLVRSSDQFVVGTNDNWQTDANASQLQAAGFAPSNGNEAGLFVTLQPGAYTAIVEGVGGGTGVAVIGVYKVN
jgi:hypothetical protein